METLPVKCVSSFAFPRLPRLARASELPGVLSLSQRLTPLGPSPSRARRNRFKLAATLHRQLSASEQKLTGDKYVPAP